MHRRTRALATVITVLALVTFALPIANLSATTGIPVAHAQQSPQPPPEIPFGCAGATTPTAPGPASSACKVAATPDVAFNPIGTDHTVTFTCGADISAEGLVGITPGLVPGCYNVTASVTDQVTGAPGTIVRATCGATAATPSGGNVNCAEAGLAGSPIVAPPAGGTAHATNTATVTINGGANHSFSITFSGYTPTTANGTCPAGTTFVPGPITLTSGILPPTQFPIVVGEGVCRFTVMAQKKYVEVTSVLVATPFGPCGGTLLFAEGLKSFFGPGCFVIAYAVGTVVLKTGVDCAVEPPNTGAAVPSYYPHVPTTGLFGVPGAPAPTYACNNGTLSVTNVAVQGVNIVFSTTGSAASFNSSPASVAGLCAGTPGPTSVIDTTTPFAEATLCPLGPGNGTIRACVTGPLANGTVIPPVNNQPGICSASISFTFTVIAQRVVPYVKWAGEKVVLKKCFGSGLRFQPVEFTLKGNNPGLQATLIPVQLNQTPALGSTQGGGALTGPVGNQGVLPGTFATADTVWTTTDLFGCASVIGYADGEGVMSVDAAIFSVSDAAAPLVNEHAFQIYYLKLDHVDLENIKFATYTTASTLSPYMSFISRTPLLGAAGPYTNLGTGGLLATTQNTTLPNALPKSFTLPGPPGSGQVAGPTPYAVPLCQIQYVRAMVHGYFEYPGDPSGRPAAAVAIPGAPAGSAGSYVLPAGRWVLPEDWPLLATFAGFGLPSGPGSDFTPASVMAFDLNSGWAFNPTGEAPVLCGLGSGVISGSTGLLLAPLPPPSNNPSSADVFGNIPVVNTTSSGGLGAAANGAVDLGPCFGQDANLAGGPTFYGTAPGSLTELQQAVYNTYIGGLGSECSGGATIGINPFDATQACTDPYPLLYSPAGSGVTYPVQPGFSSASVCGSGAPGCFDITPTSANSTYLPNGTLNLWDAPMPPSMVSFGITSGPGFLDQVNKTGLYSLTMQIGTRAGLCLTGFTLSANGAFCQQLVSGAFTAAQCAAAGGAVVGSLCTTPLQLGNACDGGFTSSRHGTTFNATLGACLLELDPNPFYAEAIPSMPEIPPVANNGGYLWNSWNFNSGVITDFIPGTGVYGARPGGFVPGESTTFPIPGGLCAPGFTLNQTTGLCETFTITQAQCQAFVGATFNTLTGVCGLPTTTAMPNAPGGVNLTNFGNCVVSGGERIPGFNPMQEVVVGNGAGFQAGMTVEVYSTANGVTIVPGTGPGSLMIASVTPAGQFDFPAGSVILTFTAPTGLATCLPAFTAIFESGQFGIPISGISGFVYGQTIEIGPLGPFTLCGFDNAAGIIYTCSSEAVARTLGNCLLSRTGVNTGVNPPFTVGAGLCEPADLAPPNTEIVTGVVSGLNLTGPCSGNLQNGTFPNNTGDCNLGTAGPAVTPDECRTLGGVVSTTSGTCTVSPVPAGGCAAITSPGGVVIPAGTFVGFPNAELPTACVAGLANPDTIVTAQSSCGPERFFDTGAAVQGAGGNANGTIPGGFNPFLPFFGAQGPTTVSPSLAEFCAPPNPYPFWQWLSAPSAPGTQPTSATVYSDNHGEAVVSLQNAVAAQIAAVCPQGFNPLANLQGTICVNSNGAQAQAICPTGYTALPVNGIVVGCLLPFSALAGSFGNVAAALNAFSSAKPGCIQTFASGTTAPLPGTTVGAAGPGAGQICVNNLGGIEFGAAAALGSTTIQAVADYPYTREHAPIASAPLTKVWTSLFAKTLTVSPATPGPAGTTSYVVTVTALDVCGNPLVGEPVEVFVLGNAGAAVLAPIQTGGVLNSSTTSATVLVVPTGPSAGTATLSLEILNTAVGTQGLVVKAVFPIEKIERFVTVIPGTTPGQTATVTYPPGWNQVGGPPGSNFSVAEALFSWDATAQNYGNATAAAGNLSSAAPACTGYWAYFAAAMSVSLPATSKAGDTANCTLAAGWNLIGNPFASPATIGGGQTAYHWNGTSYDVVGTIPVGGSVWIFSASGGSVTLTAT